LPIKASNIAAKKQKPTDVTDNLLQWHLKYTAKGNYHIDLYNSMQKVDAL